MIDPWRYDWPVSHPWFKIEDSAYTWWKMIDPHRYDWPGSCLKFNSSDLACTWWKMIDSHRCDHPVSPKTLKIRFSLHMVKDDWPLQVWLTSITPKIVKLRFSLDMKRWFTPQGWPSSIWAKTLKLRFSLHMAKDDWPLQVWLTSMSPKILNLRF